MNYYHEIYNGYRLTSVGEVCSAAYFSHLHENNAVLQVVTVVSPKCSQLPAVPRGIRQENHDRCLQLQGTSSLKYMKISRAMM